MKKSPLELRLRFPQSGERQSGEQPPDPLNPPPPPNDTGTPSTAPLTLQKPTWSWDDMDLRPPSPLPNAAPPPPSDTVVMSPTLPQLPSAPVLSSPISPFNCIPSVPPPPPSRHPPMHTMAVLYSPAMIQKRTHSRVMVPFILAAMDIDHPGVSTVREKYGMEVFQGAVEEIRSVLPSLSNSPRVLLQLGMNPYIHADDQNAILDLHFQTFHGGGHLQTIQNDVVISEAAAQQSTRFSQPIINQFVHTDQGSQDFVRHASIQNNDRAMPVCVRNSIPETDRTRNQFVEHSATPIINQFVHTNQGNQDFVRHPSTLNSGRVMPVCVLNTIPETVSVPLCECHPVLLASAATIMLPGTAFQLVMGGHRQKIVCGFFLSPSEWYCDGFTRPRNISEGIVQFDFRMYPGSHIAMTRTDKSLWATMFLTRIDAKVFEIMLKKIDSRIVNEIHRRCNPENLPSPTIHSAPTIKYVCNTCKREFSSSKGLKQHVCDPTLTDITRVSCSICTNKTFSKQGYLDRHMHQWHGSLTSTKIGGEPSPLPDSTSARALPEVGSLSSNSPFRVVDCTKTTLSATVVPPPAPSLLTPKPKTMLYDAQDDSSVDASQIAGLSSDEILAVAGSWAIGQEYVMTYQEKGTDDEYEAHGMFIRWDMTNIGSPEMAVCYVDDSSQGKKRQRYCEEMLDCTARYVVLRLTTIPPSKDFDAKRRAMNRGL